VIFAGHHYRQIATTTTIIIIVITVLVSTAQPSPPVTVEAALSPADLEVVLR